MPNILDILARAQSLMNETALNSITPPRAGGIMYDTLLVLNQMQLEGASLLISKVYASVSAMEADTTPTSDLTGRALKPGQLVVIVTSDTSSSDMGSEYRYNGPGSWTYVGKVGGLPLDTVPTQSSTKGITSGGVYAALSAMKAEGYKYMGIATPGSGGTAPGTPNQPVFYIAGPGSYPNFGSITVASGYLGFIKYSGGSWSVESVAVGKDYDRQLAAIEHKVTGVVAPSSLYTDRHHAYTYTGGVYGNANNYWLTNAIKIDDIKDARANGINVLSGKCGIGNTGYYLGLVFFDASGDVMLTESQAATGTEYRAGTTIPASLIPATAVSVRFTVYSQVTVEFIIKGYGLSSLYYEQSVQDTRISQNETDILKINDVTPFLDKNLYTNRAAIDTNGGKSYPNNYWGTSLLPIDMIENARTEGIKVLTGGFGIANTYCGVAFYDVNRQFMQSESVALVGQLFDTNNPLLASYIPATAVYIRFGRYGTTSVPLVIDGCGFDTLFFKAKDIHPTEDTLMSASSVNPLSARQGNVLLDKLKNGWASVDVQDLTSIPMIIGKTPSDGVYKWESNRSNSQQISLRRHTRIKCTKGDKFFVKANATNPFSYAWLTSYEATYNQAAPLVAGTVPTDVPAGGYAFLEAPEGAEFLYMRRSITGIGNTELLPEIVMRLATYEEETAVPVSLINCCYDTTTGKVISYTSGAVRAIKVTKGDKVRFATSYTDSNNTGRPIYLGFSKDFPTIGADVTIIDRAYNYAAKVTYNDYYVAPFDGYFIMSTQTATVYYTKYSFHRVLKEADAAHPLRNEKIIVFGDSILSFTDSFAGNRGFVEFLAEYTGAIVIRGSIGGTRLVPRASGAFRAFDISNLIHSWVNDDWTDVDAALVEEPSYTTIINNLKAVRPSEITAIVMDGGGNDLSNPSLSFGDETASDIFNENPTNDTLFGAINYIMRDLFTVNNRLKVFWLNGLVGFAGSSVSSRTKENWVDNRSYTVDGQTYTSKEYRDKIYDQVSKWKIPLISMTDICINPITFGAFFYDNDNTHPYKGFYRMASIVASQLVAKMFQ